MEIEVKDIKALYQIGGDMEVVLTVPRKHREMVSEFCRTFDKEKKYQADIRPKRERRSNDASAYCWTLLNKLAAVLPGSAKDIYRSYIDDIGDNSIIVPVKDEGVDAWIHNWQHEPKTKIGWISYVLGPCKNAKGYTNTLNYYGSSTFDKRQMARFIDLVVEDCKLQGIETKTPDEIAKLKDLWREK